MISMSREKPLLRRGQDMGCFEIVDSRVCESVDFLPPVQVNRCHYKAHGYSTELPTARLSSPTSNLDPFSTKRELWITPHTEGKSPGQRPPFFLPPLRCLFPMSQRGFS